MGKSTYNSRLARQIFAMVAGMQRPFSISFQVENETVVRQTLLKLMRDKEEYRDVRTSILPGSITVFSQEPTREEQLVEMIRKLLLHCDDEHLYEQAFKLVEVK